MQRRITVVGSCRTHEVHIYDFKHPSFFTDICAGVGAWVRRSGHVLRIGWSNDHLLKQSRPEVDGLETFVRNDDGTLSADPEHCRFLFEETADYHAMRGYLESAAASPQAGGHIELDISDQMLSGSRDRNTLSWPPVGDRVMGGHSISAHIRNGTIVRYEVDGRRDFEYFRSKYLSNMISSDGPREVDLVVAVGGGKASGTLYHTALERLKLLPLPYCGGEAQRVFMHAYARRTSRAAQRLSYVFGYDMPEVASEYTADSVPAVLQVLDNVERFFNFPYRVFVAFPYGQSTEQRSQQDLLFQIIQRAVANVSGRVPNRYPGATAIRIDEQIIGTREVHREMWNQIRNSGVIMGELTPLDPDGAPNPNVFYELGFADGTFAEKPHLLTARLGTTVPFDVGNKRIYYWRDLEHFEQVCAEQFSRIFEAIHTNLY